MKVIGMWMLLFGVFAGLNARVLAPQGDSVCLACHHAEDHGTHHHGHSHEDCDPDHPHHHDCCSPVQPLGVENHSPCRLGFSPESFLLGVRQEGELPPEEPFLSSEKPPLI
ncbi:MAG: hypothetical protein ACRCXD_07380 [Luteolibacter sp.]